MIAVPLSFVLLLLLAHWEPELKIQRNKLEAKRKLRIKNDTA